MLTVDTEVPSAPAARSAAITPSKAVVALAIVAAIAPFDLAMPTDGWTALHARPLMLVVLAVSAWTLVRNERSTRGLCPLEFVVGFWLVAVWASAAISATPLLGAAGAIRLTTFGVLVLATHRVVRTAVDTRLALRGLAVGLLVACTVGLVVLFAGGDVLGTDRLVGSITSVGPHDRLTRPWSHANVAGMAIGASLPAVALGGRTWRVGAVVLVVPALILTYSRGAVIAVIAAAIVIVAVRRSRSDAVRVAAMMAFGLAVLVASPAWAARIDPPSTHDRRGAAIEAPQHLLLDPVGVTSRVSVSNLSNRVWPAGGSDRVELSARWVGRGQDWIWGEQRWALPGDLAPGESVEMAVPIDATIPVGAFDVRWDLVGPGGVYFLSSLQSSTSSSATVVESSVDPLDVEPMPLVDGRRPLDRIETWTLAAGAFLDAPLLGVGPSELEVAVRSEVGDDRQLLGRHAHSLALEPLATTGLLGAVPLFVLLSGGLRLAFRRARRTRGPIALATLAGLTATLVHGLVDWPLVYTSAAVPIAMLSGIAWTWRADEKAVADPPHTNAGQRGSASTI